MITLDCRTDERWLDQAVPALRHEGYCVVEGVLDGRMLAATREAMYRAQEAIRRDVGEARLKAAGELGVLRLMLRWEPHFLRLLELPEVLAAIDATVSPTAIMHLQNGFILPSFATDGSTPR